MCSGCVSLDRATPSIARTRGMCRFARNAWNDVISCACRRLWSGSSWPPLFTKVPQRGVQDPSGTSEGRHMPSRRFSPSLWMVLLLVAAILVPTTLAASRGDKTFSTRNAYNDRRAPKPVSSLNVEAADSASVTLDWSRTWDNVGVEGYGVYLDGARKSETASTDYTFDQPCLRQGLHPWRRCIRRRREPLPHDVDVRLHRRVRRRNGAERAEQRAHRREHRDPGDPRLVAVHGRLRSRRIRVVRRWLLGRAVERAVGHDHEPLVRPDLPDRNRRVGRCRQ